MVKERPVEYRHDGHLCEGWFAWDDRRKKPMPAVLIAHAWAGRSEFECAKARALAGLGYAGFAMDLYGKGVLGKGPDENMKLMQPFMQNRAKLQDRLKTALAALQSQPEVDRTRVVAIGFCFGGLCALDMARSGADVRGVVSLHGLFAPPGNTQHNKIKAKVLALHGQDDPMVPVTQVEEFERELTSAGADWQIHVYGNTMHAFTNPEADDPKRGTVYNAVADRRSWRALLNFLEEVAPAG